jgi:branched-chain amino acid transport system ATP-binding protein
VILQTKGLTKSFGGVRAIDQVDFDLEPGIIQALIGPNGAGKTTFFNVITGLFKADGGMVLFGGLNITGWKPYQICHKGLSRTFQIINIFPRLSVFENIQMAVVSHKRETKNLFAWKEKMFREEVFHLLEIIGLSDKCDSIGGNMSLGEKKRLEMAIALANEPKLLLLDEPTSGMGPEETTEIMDLVKKLRDELKITICFVEHDMNAVFHWAERITVLHQGKIIASGSPLDIKNNQQVQRVYLGGEV